MQIDQLHEHVERLIAQVGDNIRQMSTFNSFMAQLSQCNVLNKMKELNAFDDLHARLTMVTELRANVDRNTESIDTINERTIKEYKNIKFEMGKMIDKHDHLNEMVVKNADTVEINKKDTDLIFRRVDGNIENLKTRINESTAMVNKPNTSSGPSFKMDDLFNHGRFKALEEFEEFARDRFSNLEYKVQHIDINALDTSEFVKSHNFEQFSRKV